ncbi:carbohydrate-binding family 9-like protein, partial [Sphingomonas sp.]|uniref:carbohydrate-binding family 9-like protein n=1 Tax=Sphingomonas sp. TaxID=28214 RepID=UPI0025CC6445
MLATLAAIAMAQIDPVGPLPHAPPQPRSYGCVRVASAPPMDGHLGHKQWAAAPWTEDFIDIEGLAKPSLRTRVKMLWDARCLYIGAEMVEPQLWATLTERDSVIFHDNDFEVFLDPDGDNHNYVEFEMNALNTVWDLLLPKPYRDGGPAVDAFNIEGLRTGVKLFGQLNRPTVPSSRGFQGWTATIAIPWKALRPVAGTRLPPRDGDRWRINFSRVEWDLEVADGKYVKIQNRPEHNWVWSPQWAINMHRPETWGFLEFQ